MNRHRQPSQAHMRAWNFCAELSRRIHSQSTVRLPTIANMARMCNVAPETLRKVIKECEHQGFVQVSTRRGITLIQPIPEKAALTNSNESLLQNSAWQNVEQYLHEDILNNIYSPGSKLPAIKEMCRRYKVAPQTMRKHLNQAIGEGLLHQRSRFFYIAPSAHHLVNNSILVVVASQTTADVVSQTSRSPQFWREFEDGCRSYNCEFTVCPYKEIISGKYDHLVKERILLGSVIITTDIPVPDLTSIIHTLAGYSLPCVVLDEISKQRAGEIAKKYSARKNVHVFSLGTSTIAGESMGKFLLKLGHRHIAFFNLPFTNPVMQSRFRGIQKIYASAGFHSAVTRFSSETIMTPEDAFKEIRTHRIYGPIIKQSERLIASARLSSGMRHEVAQTNNIHHIVTEHFLFEKMNPIFHEALANSAITAWVCATDTIALLARTFLSDRKPSLPDISLAAFDNSLAALSNELTSYDFNIPGVVNRIIRRIAYNELNPRRSRPEEVPGFIAARLSTKPVSSELPHASNGF